MIYNIDYKNYDSFIADKGHNWNNPHKMYEDIIKTSWTLIDDEDVTSNHICDPRCQKWTNATICVQGPSRKNSSQTK